VGAVANRQTNKLLFMYIHMYIVFSACESTLLFVWVRAARGFLCVCTKSHNFGIFRKALEWKILVHIFYFHLVRWLPYGIFYGQLVNSLR
jgi:hypothetical protein